MRFRQSLVTAAMLLGVCGVALADNDCSFKTLTLHGSYVFAATGYNIVAGVAQPKAIVEAINFNGDGTLSVPAATVSLNGTIMRSPPGGTGTYTVEPGCTGTLTFTGGPSFDIVISPKGDKLWMIQSNPNTVLQGIATRASN